MNGPSQQRRQEILAEVFEKAHVNARDLASRMNVSEATVRRDLKFLAEEGRIELVYGGATLRRPSDYSVRSKAQRNVEAKRAIGRLAASLVGDDELIFLDSGTTCFEMSPFLKRRRNLSVIVNSARLALELDAPGLSAILLGGQYRPDRLDCVGPLATATLSQLRGYMCFIGADGVDMEFGLSAADIESANLYRQAVHNARQTVLLIDHTKFHNLSLFKIVDWAQVQQVVTDQAPSAQWQEFLSRHNIEILHPESKAPEIDPVSAAKANS
jgi:DeoR/GlpR family transcriptional regulator of sugar metabolism